MSHFTLIKRLTPSSCQPNEALSTIPSMGKRQQERNIPRLIEKTKKSPYAFLSNDRSTRALFAASRRLEVYPTRNKALSNFAD
eukprot:1602499-Pyramimonas_sp.AAC.1